MQHDVGRFEHITTCIPDDGQVHQILKTILIRIGLTLILSVLVDLDNWAVDYKCTVVGKSLQALFVITVAEFRFQVLIQLSLFFLVGLISRELIVNIFQIGPIFLISIVLEVA